MLWEAPRVHASLLRSCGALKFEQISPAGATKSRRQIFGVNGRVYARIARMESARKWRFS